MQNIPNKTDKISYFLFMLMFGVMPASYGILAGASITMNILAKAEGISFTNPFGAISKIGLSLWVAAFVVLAITGIFSRYNIGVKANILYTLLLLVMSVLGGTIVGLFMWLLLFELG